MPLGDTLDDPVAVGLPDTDVERVDDTEVVGTNDEETLELTDTVDDGPELPDIDTEALPELDKVVDIDGEVLRLSVTVADALGLRVAFDEPDVVPDDDTKELCVDNVDNDIEGEPDKLLDAVTVSD